MGKVDPGALLIAVLAVGINPLLDEGRWHVFNTLTAVVVLLVVWAFTLTAESRRSLTGSGPRLAVAAVVGLIAAVAVAYPVQQAMLLTTWGRLVKNPPVEEYAAWASLCFGLLAALALRAFLSRDARQDPS